MLFMLRTNTTIPIACKIFQSCIDDFHNMQIRKAATGNYIVGDWMIRLMLSVIEKIFQLNNG